MARRAGDRAPDPDLAGWLAALMMVVYDGIVFSGVQFGLRVMLMAEPDDRAEGGLAQHSRPWRRRLRRRPSRWWPGGRRRPRAGAEPGNPLLIRLCDPVRQDGLADVHVILVVRRCRGPAPRRFIVPCGLVDADARPDDGGGKMRDTLRLGLDFLLVGLAAGPMLMVALVLLDAGGLRQLVVARGAGQVAVMMVAVLANAPPSLRCASRSPWCATTCAPTARTDLRRRLLIPAQRRRRWVAGPQQP